jgi:hypothetical protein
MPNRSAGIQHFHAAVGDGTREPDWDVTLSSLESDEASRPAREGLLATPKTSQCVRAECTRTPWTSVPLAVRGSKCVERLSFVHRSIAGPEREVVVLGHPSCRRCAFLMLGLPLGFLFGVAWPPTAWIGLAAVPAVIDAVNEKLLFGRHHPLRLSIVSMLVGWLLGAWCEWLFLDGSLMRLSLIASSLFITAKLWTSVHGRSAASETTADWK